MKIHEILGKGICNDMNKSINKIRISSFLIFGFLILCYSCTEDKDLNVFAEKLRIKNNIPGMAVAVVKADTILELFTLGYRQEGHPDEIQLNDRFHIGSNTKSMTSFIAAHLVEKELIDWSTSFTDLYPEWKTDIDSLYWNVTLGALLSHRGKIQKFWMEEEFDSVFIDTGSKSEQRREFNKYALNRNPIVPDSMGYCYSNAGYSIAAQMLEKASNSTWEELMVKVFNEDLSLDIGFSWPNRMDENQPWGHWTENGKPFSCPPDDDYNLDWLEPGGDVNISLPNYCKFIQLNLQGLLGNDNYLKSATYNLLHTDRNGPIYAYGWADFINNGRNYSFHAGSAGTFLVNASIDKSESIAYIIMMNTDSPAAREMVVKLRGKMEKMYGGIFTKK